MATLTRSRTVDADDQLARSVPSPFSREDILRELSNVRTYERDDPEFVPGDLQRTPQSQPRARVNQAVAEEAEIPLQGNHHDVMPSIAYVQISVLTTLSDLLSSSKPWQPTLPDRRHSMPAHAQSSARSRSQDTLHPLSALQNLITDLRNRNPTAEMIEAPSSADEDTLLGELQTHVGALVPALDADDAELASTLASLLAHLSRLSVLGISPSTSPIPAGIWTYDTDGNGDAFDALTRQLSDLQNQRQTQQDAGAEPDALPPVLAVEKELLWTRIDDQLDTVLRLCRHRRALFAVDSLPQYDAAGYEFEGPPGYELSASGDLKAPASTSTATLVHASVSAASEKMRLDLDAVTMAIDRLYSVAPQLYNQRVELKSSKLEELERARRTEGKSEAAEGKRKERELTHIVDMIGRASERKYSDQTVTLEGGMNARLERARQREVVKRQEFVGRLMEHSAAGRMHSQDASFHSFKPKDPNAMLTLPEFIRESMPKTLQPAPDPNTMLTFSEAVLEAEPPAVASPGPLVRTKSGKGLRSRSMSAPSLNWLLPSGSRPGSETRPTKSGRSSRPTSSSGHKSATIVPSELSVSYVAEHHENLRHVLAFLNVNGTMAGANLEATVVAPEDETQNPYLVLRSGNIESPPLALPVRITPGAQDVRVQGMHYEVKFSAFDSPPAPESVPLLDATQLIASSPTAFICASCSLPLVQSARITRYDDLPSEHWAELVDAWMCHSDQKLSAQVARHGQGFWPETGQALVGGSYILFDASAVVKNNLWLSDQPKHGEEWRTVRCICGAFGGRCQDHVTEAGKQTTVFRLVKYAIRPVSPSAEPSRIPLSAFIVEDMAELARAHATYRFVVLDEEEERPRLLIWLFKPSIRISYLAQSPYLLPRRGVFQAAKVIYKIVGPDITYTDLSSLLDRYPGFPQAEQLMYPKDTCTSLAGLLKESTRTYPESMRTMTGLDVGWLLRA